MTRRNTPRISFIGFGEAGQAIASGLRDEGVADIAAWDILFPKAEGEKLKAAGWQDDARFAENLVRSRAAAGFGPLRIRAELGTHGLEREAVTTAMEGFDGDWTEIARDLVKRRFGSPGMQDRAQQRKAAELLIRRGFGGDQVRAATRFDPDE